MPTETAEEQKYSVDKKKIMAKKISQMRNKKHLKDIKKIIFKENPKMKTDKSSRGQHMFFQNCTYDTYVKLDDYMKKIELERIEEQTRSITEASDNLLFSSEMDESKTIDYAKARTRLRYSNHEKKLIRRKKYEQIISERFDTENSEPSSGSIKSDSDPIGSKKIKKVKKKNDNSKKKPSIFSKA